eukprot:TRINITY_DN5780_c0_g1_i4.p1 TRINITY_DN5780_c0_g1~~TRINITY_DN5780_c0_g1_i4.p1  ORF type:complete len:114 (+),score=5.73 TRINITY_DN5780_c0_g1_i4:79-420(+)
MTTREVGGQASASEVLDFLATGGDAGLLHDAWGGQRSNARGFLLGQDARKRHSKGQLICAAVWLLGQARSLWKLIVGQHDSHKQEHGLRTFTLQVSSTYAFVSYTFVSSFALF